MGWETYIQRLFFGNCEPPVADTRPSTTAPRPTVSTSTSTSTPSSSSTPTAPRQTAENNTSFQNSTPYPWMLELRDRLATRHDPRLGEFDHWLDRFQAANQERTALGRPERHLMASVPFYSLTTFINVSRDSITWRLPPPEYYLSENTGIEVHFSGRDTEFNPQNATLFNRPLTDLNYDDGLFLRTSGVSSIIGQGYASIENGRLTLRNNMFWNDLLEGVVAEDVGFFRRRDFHFTEQGIAHYLGNFFTSRADPSQSYTSTTAGQLGRELEANRNISPVALDDLADEMLFEGSPRPTTPQAPVQTHQDSDNESGLLNNITEAAMDYLTYGEDRYFHLTEFFRHVQQRVNFALNDLYLNNFLMITQDPRTTLSGGNAFDPELRAAALSQNSLTVDFDSQNFFRTLAINGFSHLKWDLMALTPDFILGAGHLNIQGTPNQLRVSANDIDLNYDPHLNAPDSSIQQFSVNTQGLSLSDLVIDNDRTLTISPGVHVERLEERYPVNDASPHAVLQVSGNVNFNVKGDFGRSRGNAVFVAKVRWDENGLHLMPGGTRLELRHFTFQTYNNYPQFAQFENSNVLLTDISTVVEVKLPYSTQTCSSPRAGFLWEIQDRERRLNAFVPLSQSPGTSSSRGDYYNLAQSFSPFHTTVNAWLNRRDSDPHFSIEVDSQLNNQTCNRSLNLHWTTHGIPFDANTLLENGDARANLNFTLLQAGLIQYALSSRLQGSWSGTNFDLAARFSQFFGVTLMLGGVLKHGIYSGAITVNGNGRINPSTQSVLGNLSINPSLQAGDQITIRQGSQEIPLVQPDSFCRIQFRGHSAWTRTSIYLTPEGSNAMASPLPGTMPEEDIPHTNEGYEFSVGDERQWHRLASWPSPHPTTPQANGGRP